MDFEQRNNTLITLSKTQMDPHGHYKLDLIASIFINNLHYFQVFRRYNSVYEFIVEDMRGDLSYYMDSTVRHTLQNLLCISEKESMNMYSDSVYSYKHNANLSNSAVYNIPDMKWSEIHSQFQAIQVNFKGILHEFNTTYINWNNFIPENLQIPKDYEGKFVQSASDKSDMSLKHSDLFSQKRTRNTWNCHCNFQPDSDSDEPNYTVLRNGTMIPKRS